jgi:nitrous oxidase accessory protein
MPCKAKQTMMMQRHRQTLYIKILLALVLSALLWKASQARSIRVKPGTSVPTIRAALAIAAHGDSILVEKGIYREQNIEVDKSVSLIGLNGATLDGEGKYEIMTVKASYVLVEGFSFIGSGNSSYIDIAALKFVGVHDVIAKNNRFTNAFFGIYCQNVQRGIVYGNTLVSNAKDEINSANGIHCWKSDSLQILRNNISGHRDGIYFEFVTQTKIVGNNSFNNVRYGLHFMFSSYNEYYYNTFRDNGAGVAVMYSRNVTMLHNRFSENWGQAAYGILMKDITDSEVRYNHFERNTAGIFMEGSNRINMKSNHFDNNGWAIKIQASCTDNTIEENNFTGNTFDIATNGSLVLNSFQGNYWDRYDGYDLNKDGVGDIPHRPVSMYSIIVERNPTTLMLFRSFMVELMDKAERIMPGMTPEALRDNQPRMKKLPVKTLSRT